MSTQGRFAGPIGLRVVLHSVAVLIALAPLAAGAPARAEDSVWPRQFDSPNGSFVIYQPQPEDLDGDLLSCRAAFSLQKDADANPIFGVLWFTQRIEIDRDSSTVTGRSLDVTKVRLPGITPAEADRYETLVESQARRWDLSGSLDELKAGLAATEKERASVAGLDNTPPRIRFVYERAFLVPYDGPPALEPIEGSRLERVANTPYAIVHDPASRTYYLSGANVWYRATDPLGPWIAISSPPSAVRRVVPPDTSSADRVLGTPPRVITATEPTELISIDGQPQYAPLVEDELLYVTNTESDVVRLVSTQAIYVLLAGRWYTAPGFDGPWSFVRGDRLPAAFRAIPPESPRGHLLAAVAGTDQADDAVADAEIPQTSAITRDGADFEVIYDGRPEFEDIPGTHMQYAVNTDAEVIFADGRYYACDQGVWYIADDPEGPWEVSETRPLELDDIPPSCPVYDVRYVYIYDVTPTYISMGYLPGYLGCYPYYGTVVYGTGYRYRPWRGHRHYYPRPCTWGFHPRYNPWLGRWVFGYTYGSGFFRTGWRWGRGLQIGRRTSLPRWFGAGGYRRPLLGRNLSLLRTRPPGRSPARDADPTPMNLYRRPVNVGRVDRTASHLPLRPFPPVRPTSPNNVFAGKDGKVYKRETEGTWKVNEGRLWKPTRVPDRRTAAPAPAVPVRPGFGGRSSWPPARPQPPSTPPAPRPNERRIQPQPAPARPAAPVLRPEPGNLEREFRARQRAGERPPSVAPPPPKSEPAKPAPAKPAPEPPKNPFKRKP